MTTSEYNQCVHEWADGLFRFALKSIGDRDEGKDVVQQAFAVLWEKRTDVPLDKGKSFLFTIAYRKCMDYHRGRERIRSAENIPEHFSTEQPKNNDLKKILQQALSRLEPQSRNLIMLKDYEGYSYEEIGKLTDLNESQVKVYLHRARKVLKNYLVNKDLII